jgi:hypothetical protein
MTDEKYKSLSGDDIRRVFHDGEVVPIEPIKMEIRRIPIEEFMAQMCPICPCGNPRKFLDELAELPPMPIIPMVESQSVEEAKRRAEEDEGVFLQASHEALEEPSDDS